MRKASDARKQEIADHKKFVHIMYGNKDGLSDELRVDLLKTKLNNLSDLEIEKLKL